MYNHNDHAYMARALELAARGLYSTTPNPRVGCVIAAADSNLYRVLAEGWHEQAGQGHAEVRALQAAQAQGIDVTGATVYVTLEPCSHHGRTPPCVEALIAAKVGRVVVAMTDPNPLVAGAGLARLRAAGIEVRCGLLAAQAAALNPGFIQRMRHGRPWVRLKVATSLDGQIALASGESQWITGQQARDDGHHWRARACAILTGSGTVRADNPQLSVRAVATTRQPLRYVLDSRLTLSPTARIFAVDAATPATLITTVQSAQAFPDLMAAWQARGITVWCLPADAEGHVSLVALLAEFARHEINELHVEAGSHLNGRLLAAALVDEILHYQAPKILGPGKPAFEFGQAAPTQLAAAPQFDCIDVVQLGGDVRIRYQRQHVLSQEK
ncbi:bifunctional diaminohydroxyphosphoribosylaminopyrimidine deaminase/5-amino-6-(5-phosphoribosylamino)uracil reductase RibD [Parvibium lacunae]|uniref:Riboflavin biosynthesis protein RibD n=1 Tax=Parvibium lacunae TaxID=1888893 RepID=A0A368L4V6_9BURK|nr:bifunctional diaminohydroxyphosphoribosylaminopyrimidine deaminase/5-amino-6-(5-phosphoribosylamino)uracil reductase RibD [Parvibium lacunae]RCS58545.1 bifunctional diaminohydroxyphosphoribosylaminopyrimidine deaminase/5-amino-6-(5-phosphoribosylamino)uracil reductase RibD [Parvibium lacunae]